MGFSFAPSPVPRSESGSIHTFLNMLFDLMNLTKQDGREISKKDASAP